MKKNNLLSFKNLKKKYFATKSQIYFKTLGLFVALFFLVIVHGFTTRPSNDFVMTNMYELHSVSGGTIMATKMDYYDTENTYRLDVFLDVKKDSNDLSKVELQAKVITRTDTENEIEAQVIQVTDRYYSIFVPEIQGNYGAVRFDISYRRNEGQEFSTARIYAAQENTAIRKGRIENISFEDLVADSLNNDIRMQQNLIKQYQEENVELRKTIQNVEKKIVEFEEEKEYQIADEIAITDQNIKKLEQQISSVNNSITTNLESINSSNEKIDLIELKIKEVKEGAKNE